MPDSRIHFPPISGLLLAAFLLTSPSLFAQKGTLKGGSSGSGKSAIKASPDPQTYSTPEPVRYSEPEPVYYSEPEPEPTYYSEPEPTYYSEPEPEPTYYSEPEPVPYSEPVLTSKPDKHTYSEPSTGSEVIYSRPTSFSEPMRGGSGSKPPTYFETQSVNHAEMMIEIKDRIDGGNGHSETTGGGRTYVAPPPAGGGGKPPVEPAPITATVAPGGMSPTISPVDTGMPPPPPPPAPSPGGSGGSGNSYSWYNYNPYCYNSYYGYSYNSSTTYLYWGPSPSFHYIYGVIRDIEYCLARLDALYGQAYWDSFLFANEYLEWLERARRDLDYAGLFVSVPEFEARWRFHYEEYMYRQGELRDLDREYSAYFNHKRKLIQEIFPRVKRNYAPDSIWADTALAAPNGGFGYYTRVLFFNPDDVRAALREAYEVDPGIGRNPDYLPLSEMFQTFPNSAFEGLLLWKCRKDYAEGLAMQDNGNARWRAQLVNAWYIASAVEMLNPSCAEATRMREQVEKLVPAAGSENPGER